MIKIKTKLKFARSSRTGAWVGFVSIDAETGRVKGVREHAPGPKKVCVASNEIAGNIIENVLYDVEMIPMDDPKSGYVVINAEPHQFEATISTTLVKNAVYMVEVRFGNKKIVYNPMDGRTESMRTIAGAVRVLEERVDVVGLPQVIDDFCKAANILLMHYKSDGYYVKEQPYKAKTSA